MPSETTALTKTTHHDALEPEDARRLAGALAESDDATVFVNGTSVRLPEPALEAVLDLLARLAAGDAITLSTAERWLNTSQAARLAGVSNTYLRRLTDAGTIPVHYRGTHRRIRPQDVLEWAASREPAQPAELPGAPEGKRASGDATPQGGGKVRAGGKAPAGATPPAAQGNPAHHAGRPRP